MAVCQTALRSSLADFVEYWTAASLFLDGSNPYDAGNVLEFQRRLGWGQELPLMMWNPPHTLALFLPFALLPFEVARAVWIVFCATALLLSADWLWRFYGGKREQRWIPWVMVFLFVPVTIGLAMAQLGVVFLPAVTLFLWATHKQRWEIAGTALLLLAMKPHLFGALFLFVLLWVFQKKSRAVLIIWAAVVLISVLGALSWWRPSLLFNYLQASTSDVVSPFRYVTPTTGALLRLLMPSASPILTFIPTLLGGIVSLSLWRSWKSRFSWDRHLPAILTLSVVSAPFYWLWDAAILFLPMVLLLKSSLVRRHRLLFGLLVGIDMALYVEIHLIASFSLGTAGSAGIWFPWLTGILLLLSHRSIQSPGGITD